jgi:hypothetical protein
LRGKPHTHQPWANKILTLQSTPKHKRNKAQHQAQHQAQQSATKRNIKRNKAQHR